MDARVQRNRRFLTDLFSGPFPGHGIIFNPVAPPKPGPHDLASSELPLMEWVDWGMREFQAQSELLEALDHDDVPSVKVSTGTQIFAAAFGSPVHLYEDNLPCALPCVATAEEADAVEMPAIDAPPLDRCWEYGRLMSERLGPEVPIRVPDIQSPFDIAALIWRKEEMFLAMIENPAAVKRLVRKCQDHLTAFLKAWKEEFAEPCLVHCPNNWAPPELGCSLSEDEAGAMSTPMFEEFCIPGLIEMSEEFGGIFVHCCADADHQYESFKKLPNLRGMNRVFQASGPLPAIEAFTPGTVLVQAWMPEQAVLGMLEMALPETRFLFNMPEQPLEQARRTYERLREKCPRG